MICSYSNFEGWGRGGKIFFKYLWVKVLSVLQGLVDRKSVSNFLTKKGQMTCLLVSKTDLKLTLMRQLI